MHLQITLIPSWGIEKWDQEELKLCALLNNNDKTAEVRANHLNAPKPVTNRDALESSVATVPFYSTCVIKMLWLNPAGR